MNAVFMEIGSHPVKNGAWYFMVNIGVENWKMKVEYWKYVSEILEKGDKKNCFLLLFSFF